MHSLGENLKKLRKDEHLTQQQVADNLNIGRVNYTRYETGAVRPDYETIIALADFYGVTIDELFGRENIK